MLSLACRDAGVKDCDYVAKGETEDELWKDGTVYQTSLKEYAANLHARRLFIFSGRRASIRTKQAVCHAKGEFRS